MSEHVPVSIRLIVRCVAEAFEVDERAILSHRRTAELMPSRLAVYWLAHRFQVGSSAVIGRHLNNRDHTTVLHGIEACEQRRADDHDYAAKLDAVEAAVAYLSRTRVAERFRDPDPVAVAERVMLDPRGRAVMAVSEIELVALCGRLLALEDVAGATYRLLAQIDELDGANRVGAGFKPAPTPARVAGLRQSIRALIDSVASTLAALGYADTETNNTENDHDDAQEQDARPQLAGAAE